MNDIPETDEELLRTRLHTIGDAIEHRHAEGRDGLFEPRRPRRILVSASVAAAAAVVLVVVAITLTSGPGQPTTRVMAGSGQLDGLDVSGMGLTTSMVSTPRGIVVIKANRDGHPAIYLPDRNGTYQWYLNHSAPALAPLTAWRDGDVIRVVGHQCPVGSPADKPGPNSRMCVTNPIIALEFAPATQQWSSKSTTFDTHGLEISTVGAVGNGHAVVAPVLPDEAADQDGPNLASQDIEELARLDVEDGSVTPLHGKVHAPIICPSGDTFLVGTKTVQATAFKVIDPNARVNTTADPRTIGVVEGERIHATPIDVPKARGDGRVTGGWCAVGGMEVDVMLKAGGDRQRAPIVVASVDEGSVTVKEFPAAPLPPTSVTYDVDGTGTVLAASIHKGKNGESFEVALWDPDRRTWKRLPGVLSTPEVAVDENGRVFIMKQPVNGPGPTVLRRVG